MTIHLFTINHQDCDLAAVERATTVVPELDRRLIEYDEVLGVIILATCNRVEIYLDVVSGVVPRRILEIVTEACGSSLPWRMKHHGAALWHLLAVACGLSSIVVGEREIAGQVRTAMRQALARHTSSLVLTESFKQAMRVSRRVAAKTAVAGSGVSIVTVALDMAGIGSYTDRNVLEVRDTETDFDPATATVQHRVLLIGTGAYAGAVVAHLRRRNQNQISVYSVSSRAEEFAADRGLLIERDLVAGLASADVVICCRGREKYVVTKAEMEQALAKRTGLEQDQLSQHQEPGQYQELSQHQELGQYQELSQPNCGGAEPRPVWLLDLALSRDVDPAVTELPGIKLITLPDVQERTPAANQEQVALAEEIVAEGVAELQRILDGRRMDPAVRALREAVASIVEEEIQKLPAGETVRAEEAQYALRRLAARLTHVPSVRARQAASSGHSDRYLAALVEVLGIEAQLNDEPNVDDLARETFYEED